MLVGPLLSGWRARRREFYYGYCLITFVALAAHEFLRKYKCTRSFWRVVVGAVYTLVQANQRTNSIAIELLGLQILLFKTNASGFRYQNLSYALFAISWSRSAFRLNTEYKKRSSNSSSWEMVLAIGHHKLPRRPLIVKNMLNLHAFLLRLSYKWQQPVDLQ